MKVLRAAMLLLFFAPHLFAQTPAEEFKSILLKKPGGVQIVYSGNKHSFTFDIDVKDIESTDDPGYLTLDKNTLKYTFTAAAPENNENEGAQKAQLLSWMKGEFDRMKHELKLHYSNSGHDWQVINNKMFLFWHYDVPGEDGSHTTKMNMSTVCFSHIFNLNIGLNGASPLDGRQLLMSTAHTLIQHDFKIDFIERFKALHGNGYHTHHKAI